MSTVPHRVETHKEGEEVHIAIAPQRSRKATLPPAGNGINSEDKDVDSGGEKKQAAR